MSLALPPTSVPPTRLSLRLGRVAIAVLLALALLPGTSSAGMLQFTVGGGSEFSGSGQSFSGSFLVTFQDTVANTVQVTIDAAGMTGPSTAKITSFYWNIKPVNAGGVDPTSVNLSGFSGGAVLDSYDRGTDNYKADGDGFFDFRIEFDNSGNVFGPGESVTFNLSATGLDALDFNDVSVNGPAGKNGFYVAAHVQGLGTGAGGSGWFNGTPTTIIPEPSSMVLAVIGVASFGIAGVRRLRRREAA